MVANSKLLKSIKPIVNGIQSLPTGESVYIKEKGLLSELAMNINKTSEILQSQNNQLRRKKQQGQIGLQGFLTIFGLHCQWLWGMQVN